MAIGQPYVQTLAVQTAIMLYNGNVHAASHVHCVV